MTSLGDNVATILHIISLYDNGDDNDYDGGDDDDNNNNDDDKLVMMT